MVFETDLEEAPCQTDDNLLTQALLNLLLNAVDSIEGEGKVEARLSVDASEGYLVTITDNGCGMGKDSLARLFEPANPRVVVAEGMDLIYSPLEYGGDPAAGLEKLERGLELFEAGGENRSGVDQDWGRALAWAGYGQALLRGPEPDPDRARQVLRRALEIEPQLALARRLLASLDD